MAKKALITGIGGQDGAYLAQLLLEKGYDVVGAGRRTSSSQLPRLRELGIADDVANVDLDLVEESNVRRVLEHVVPDEIYNLAAQSFVGSSFIQPIYVGEVNGLGVVRILDAVRQTGGGARLYQASTSEMFGKVQAVPQNESTPFYPRSPYAAAKLYAHSMCVNYREAYGIHCSSGILFNHESPLRGAEFVTRKITLGLCRVAQGKQDCLRLGNLSAQRDWGFAKEFVAAMWAMLQQEQPDDYVIATGKTHTVRELVALAGKGIGFDLEFEGSGLNEKAVDRKSGQVVVEVDPSFFRPAEVDTLMGDSHKARTVLDWSPHTTFAELVELMVRADYDRVARDRVAF